MDKMRTASGFAWFLLIASCIMPALAQDDGNNATPYVYVRSNVNQPWGQSTNEDAMDDVFGSGNWTTLYYETLNTNQLFNSSTVFIFMEGGDSSFGGFQAFMSAHGDPVLQQDGSYVGDGAIKSWVSHGGRLL